MRIKCLNGSGYFILGSQQQTWIFNKIVRKICVRDKALFILRNYLDLKILLRTKTGIARGRVTSLKEHKTTLTLRKREEDYEVRYETEFSREHVSNVADKG